MDFPLRYRIDGQGPPVILQGPAWGPSNDYLRIGLAPLIEGRSVVTYDPRNVGRSARVAGRRAQALEHLVDDLEALRRRLGIERFALLGHSHGGLVAMAYAIRYRHNLSALILANTALRRPAIDAEAAELLEHYATDPDRRDAVAAFRAHRGLPRDAADDAELARLLRRIMPIYFRDLDAMARFMAALRDAPAPSSAALRASPDDRECWIEEALGTVDIPTLVLTGRHDVVTPPGAARAIAGLLPAARCEIFARSGHHPWVEEPDEFREVVAGFLASSAAVSDLATGDRA